MTDNVRETLIAHVVSQSAVVVHSHHEGVSCAVIGIPVRVSKRDVLIVVIEATNKARGTETSVPIDSITKVELVDEAGEEVA